MFVLGFALNPDLCLGRGLWLLVAGPAAGFALGARRRPHDPPRRRGLLVPVAAAGWAYVAALYLLAEAKLRLPHAEREPLEEAIGVLLAVWFAPFAASLVCLLVAALSPRRYREIGVFANAAFLLAVAYGFDLRAILA